ncbi:beta-propeller domain-containing protein [Streptomyces mirabilis]
MVAIRHLSINHQDDPYLAAHQLIRKPIEQLRKSGALERDVVVLIDGLDESVERIPPTLLQNLILSLCADPIERLKLLVTTRPNGIRNFPEGSPRIDLVEDEPEGVDDVQTYAEHRLQHLEAPLVNEHAQNISKAASGNFLYAHYILEELLTQGVPSGDLYLPVGLHGVYKRFLNRQIDAVPDREAWHHRIRPVLGALAVSRGKGFTSAQLSDITGLPRSDVDHTLYTCANYLEGDPTKGPVRPYHHSFREYLRASGRHHVYPEEANLSVIEAIINGWKKNSQRWLRYAIEQSVEHLVESLSRSDAPNKMTSIVAELVTDPHFIAEKCATTGFDSFLLGLARIKKADGELPASVLFLRRALGRQCHRIRELGEPESGFILQQIANQLSAMGNKELVEKFTKYLHRRKIPHLHPRWATTRASGQLAHVIEEPSASIKSADITPDGSRAIVATYSGKPRIWDLESAVVTGEPAMYHGGCETLAISADGRRGLAQLADHRMAYMWDANTGRTLRTLLMDSWGIESLAIDDYASRAVTASGFVVHVWDLDDMDSHDPLYELEPHESVVSRATITHDGKRCITASRDVRVWNLDTGALIHTLPTGRKGHLYDPLVEVAPNDQIFAATTTGDEVCVWSLNDGRLLSTLPCDNPPDALCFTHDGRRVITASMRDAAAQVWDTHSGIFQLPLAGHRWGIKALAVAPDDSLAVSVSNDRTARVWDLATGKTMHILSSPDLHNAFKVAITPDGRRVIACTPYAVTVWELDSGPDVSMLSLCRQEVTRVAFSPDTKRVITQCRRGNRADCSFVWDTASGDNLNTIMHEPEEWVLDGRSWVADKSISEAMNDIWREVSGSRDVDASESPVRDDVGHSSPCKHIAAATHGTPVVTDCCDGLLCVWDGVTGNFSKSLRLLDHSVDCLTLTEDGRYVIATDYYWISVWSLSSGSLVARAAAEGNVTCVTAKSAHPYLVGYGTDIGNVSLCNLCDFED